MPSSQRGVRISEGLRASAQARQCPACGRNAALVDVLETDRRGEVCRWVARGLCDYPGAFVPRRV